jgi:hypothetical protein
MLPSLNNGNVLFGPYWSPNGEMLAGHDVGSLRVTGVYIYRFSDQSYKMIVDAPSRSVACCWLPDSERLFVLREQELIVINTRTLDKQVLLTDIPRVGLTTLSSPKDGSAVYFNYGSIEADIWVAELQ